MQVDPIKPTLKAPGAEALKPKCDKLLRNFAFNFNLRRCTAEAAARRKAETDAVVAATKAARLKAEAATLAASMAAEEEETRLKAEAEQAEAGAYTRALFSST